MKNKVLPITILLIAVLGNVAAYIIRNPLDFGVCEKAYLFNNKETCVDSSILGMGKPLQIFAVCLLITSILLIFFNKKVFIAWIKFGILWTIVSLFLIFESPIFANGIVGIQRDDVARVTGVLLILISLIILITKSIKLKRAEGVHQI
ncbi:MAG TPA: hypothetical protein VIR98_02560 [Candidatus Paceibacterota bacterium]|jgi:hypothetical protein